MARRRSRRRRSRVVAEAAIVDRTVAAWYTGSRPRNRALLIARLWRRCVQELRAPNRRARATVHQGVGIPAWFQGSASRDDAIRSDALLPPPRRAGSRAGIRRSRATFGDEP